MKLDLQEATLTVTREPGDPGYRPMSEGAWGAPESRLLYHIKKRLNGQGMDLIKKRMWKDGHMVDTEQQYLRTRSKRSPRPHVYIWNGSWSVYDAARRLMEDGEVVLNVERDVFNVGGGE